MANFGPLAAEILSLVWGTPGNFNGFRVLAALLHGNLSSGRRPNCGVESLYSCSFSGRPLDAWRANGPCGRLMAYVSSVGGIACSLIHTLHW